MITNTITIEASPFNGLWLSSVSITNNRASIMALPYNGTHVLVSPATMRNVALSENLLTEIRNIVKHLSGIEEDLTRVNVLASSPDRPVTIFVFFKDVPKPFIINNAYKLAESDLVFAGAFQSIMYQLGNLITKKN